MDISPAAPVRFTELAFGGFNAVTLYNTWLATALLLLAAYLAVRSLRMVPGRLQVAAEGVTEFFEEICNNTLGEEHGRRYMPFIATLFVFVLLCNVMGAVPNVLGWLGWPGFIAPTQDLNTPLGLALIVLFVVHISAIRIRGFRNWLWSFFEPSFPADYLATRIFGGACLLVALWLNYVFVSKYLDALPGMATAGRVAGGGAVAGFLALTVLVTVYAFQMGRIPNAVMAPLNVVGELGKAISHPFRLFGNVFGGFVILTVLSHLILHIGLPPLLSGFFSLFIGLVHAFVFAMLALAYTAVQIRD